MAQQSSSPGQGRRSPSRLSPRAVGGIVLAVLVIVFIALNRDKTEISFIVFTARTALWVALTVAAAGGLVAGFLLGRQRYH